MARISAKERKLAETLADPVLWGRDTCATATGTTGLLAAPGGRPALPGQNIIHLDGRDVGKSVCITTDALHFAFTNRGCQGLVAAPTKGISTR